MIMKRELARATMTWKQAHISDVMSESLQLHHRGARGTGMLWMGNSVHSPNPTTPKEFCLDDVEGHLHSTLRVTIALFGTINIHGNTDIWGNCMQVHVLAEPAQDLQLPASMVPTATKGELYPGSSQVPICPRNLSAHPIIIPTKVVVGEVAQANKLLLVVLPMETLGKSAPWLPERLDPGGIEPPRSRGVAQGRTRLGQEAASQMGKPVCLQWPGPRKDILHQTPDQIEWLDTLQRVSLVNTPHMYNDVKVHLQKMLDIGTIQTSHSPWASTVVLVWEKDGSRRFCIDLRKLNNWTIKDVYSLPLIEETLNSQHGSQWFFVWPEVWVLAGWDG